MVLSDKAHQKNIVLLDVGAFHAQKTKEALTLLKKLPLQLDEKRKKQFSVGCIMPSGSTVESRGFRNIPFAHVLPVNSLNIVDLLRVKKLVLPLASLDAIERTYVKK